MKKRSLCILMAFLLISSTFAGCQSRENVLVSNEPLRICIDTGYYEYTRPSITVEDGAYSLSLSLADRGLDNVEMEIIPASGDERDTTLTRIRAEIMAGEGPDIFLCSCVDTDVSGSDQTPLFPFPERAMADGMFLPLDSYLENAQYMEVDKMLPVAMEAGKWDNQQMIVPISFTMPVTVYKEGEAELYPADTTFEDILNSDDPFLRSTASYADRYDNQMRCCFPYLFGELADYGKGELAFSEDDLLTTIENVARLKKSETTQELPAHFFEQLSFYTYQVQYLGEDYRQGIYDSTPQVMLPLYNREGGATALINSFAAVNANTQQPENAFLVLDLVLSKFMCKNNDLYTFFCQTALPVHMEMGEYRDVTFIGSRDCPYGVRHLEPIESPAFEAYCKAREQLSYARFYTTMDQELVKLVMSTRNAMKEGDEEGIRTACSQYYEKLKRLLDES